ncbi:MAG: hypothetical protein A4S12_02285 [Proteobacteria bacterium SG_bin5]|nr:cation:proton antiporter [Sphingomonas sp.]OQW39398.1 MAG: hypothetical protein A4S12_02285 [Proteobacteria bacterium SG_bin5]
MAAPTPEPVLDLGAASPTLLVSLAIVTAAGLLALASLVKLPRSIMLFAGGVGAGLLAGSPRDALPPTLLLGLLLPPLLYSAAVRRSVELVRELAGPGLLLGAVLLVATALAGAGAVAGLAPELGWAGAALLGILASVSDTRLADELGHADKVPRRIAEILEAQSVVAPVLLLSAFLIISKAAGGAPPSAETVLRTLLADWLGGAVLGLALGFAVLRLRGALDTAPIETALSFATPFAAAAAAQLLGIAVVTPIIVAALVINRGGIDRRTGATNSSPEARVIARNFWREAALLLSSLQFLLSGFALPGAVAELGDTSLAMPALLAAALLAAAQLAVALITPVGARGLRPRLVLAALPGRSALALLIVLAIPETGADGERFLARDTVLVTVVLFVVGSVIVQWLFLGPLLRRLGYDAPDPSAKEQAAAVDRALAGADGRDAGAVAATRLRLLKLRRAGAIDDAAALDGQDRLDFARCARARLEGVEPQPAQSN